MTEREFREAIEEAATEYERRVRASAACMPVLMERRADGVQCVIMVPQFFNLSPLLPDDEWFLPRLAYHQEIA